MGSSQMWCSPGSEGPRGRPHLYTDLRIFEMVIIKYKK